MAEHETIKRGNKCAGLRNRCFSRFYRHPILDQITAVFIILTAISAAKSQQNSTNNGIDFFPTNAQQFQTDDCGQSKGFVNNIEKSNDFLDNLGLI